MNEMQLVESMHMKTVTCEHKQKHLMSVPITLPVTKEQMESFKDCKKIAIKCSTVDADILAVVEEPVFFENRKEEICTRVFGTQSVNHPQTERIMAQGDFCMSGKRTHFVKRI
jgi:3'-phosphoadenosine 5'-phosphosulfate synthase